MIRQAQPCPMCRSAITTCVLLPPPETDATASDSNAVGRGVSIAEGGGGAATPGVGGVDVKVSRGGGAGGVDKGAGGRARGVVGGAVNSTRTV